MSRANIQSVHLGSREGGVTDKPQYGHEMKTIVSITDLLELNTENQHSHAVKPLYLQIVCAVLAQKPQSIGVEPRLT